MDKTMMDIAIRVNELEALAGGRRPRDPEYARLSELLHACPADAVEHIERLTDKVAELRHRLDERYKEFGAKANPTQVGRQTGGEGMSGKRCAWCCREVSSSYHLSSAGRIVCVQCATDETRHALYERMRDMLRRVECIGTWPGCPVCGTAAVYGHAEDCELGALMRDIEAAESEGVSLKTGDQQADAGGGGA